MARVLASLAAAVVLAAGCGQAADSGGSAADGTVRIVATTGMIADAAKAVGGDRVDVTALMGPGVDPHLYKASEGDVRLLGDADLVLFNGLHLEAKLGEVLERLDEKAEAVTNGIDRSKLLAPAQFKGQYDPHVWFDVRMWMEVVREINAILSERDPDGARVYSENARRYLGELRELDGYVRSESQRVPRARRVIVTAHDAFNYFGRAYGFDVRGLQGISTATEAGAADVQALAEFIAERRIPAIFVETSVPERAIRAVREAVRSRGFDVSIGERLYSDALGDEGTPEGTYVGMVRHNVDAIVAGLLREAQ